MTIVEIVTGAVRRTVDLQEYLDPASEESAQADAYAWIKALRTAAVEGLPLRSRFTFRGDSLWWFAELYLHKDRAILEFLRTVAAIDALIEREQPKRLHLARESEIVRLVASARNLPCDWDRAASPLAPRMDVRARALALASRLSRFRGGTAPSRHARVAAFVHRAFWREGADDGGAESYIGPVLRAIEDRVGTDAVQYVGVGPRRNFRARRWWQALATGDDGAMVPIERYAAAAALRDSRALWRERYAIRDALWSSDDIRQHAVIRGCDAWPVVRDQLSGIALLQFPWSARSMDEAAAALETIEPDVAVTYAEAGGWGRALALECRRGGVPLAGLQHGFIYRHWLNYRHEADELMADAINPQDSGFPRPALTLLFDDYTARYLSEAGRFPPGSLKVTGSPRLDDLIARVNAQGSTESLATRERAGASPSQALVVFAAKHREAAPHLERLLAAVRRMPDVLLAIKPHPAETPDVYAAVAGVANVRVLEASAALPDLLAAARVLVTVNSTVAVDALSVGVPALVIGLPNNLTPFVDARVMAGASSEEEIHSMLSRLLYDEGFRGSLALASRDFLRRNRSDQDGGAAERTADAVIALTSAPRHSGPTLD
jgi:hypothetical protein